MTGPEELAVRQNRDTTALTPEAVAFLVDGLTDEATTAAWAFIDSQLSTDRIRVTDGKRLWVDMGISAGITAMVSVIAKHDLFDAEALLKAVQS